MAIGFPSLGFGTRPFNYDTNTAKSVQGYLQQNYDFNRNGQLEQNEVSFASQQLIQYNSLYRQAYAPYQFYPQVRQFLNQLNIFTELSNIFSSNFGLLSQADGQAGLSAGDIDRVAARADLPFMFTSNDLLVQPTTPVTPGLPVPTASASMRGADFLNQRIGNKPVDQAGLKTLITQVQQESTAQPANRDLSEGLKMAKFLDENFQQAAGLDGDATTLSQNDMILLRAQAVASGAPNSADGIAISKDTLSANLDPRDFKGVSPEFDNEGDKITRIDDILAAMNPKFTEDGKLTIRELQVFSALALNENRQLLEAAKTQPLTAEQGNRVNVLYEGINMANMVLQNYNAVAALGNDGDNTTVSKADITALMKRSGSATELTLNDLKGL